MKRRSIWIIAFALVVFVGLVSLFLGQTMKWVGHKDLEVRFLVTNAATGIPIANASVHVTVEPGGFCENGDQGDFVLMTDQNGLATRMSKNCMSFGSKSSLEDTFAIHPPAWRFYATGEGYANSEPRFAEDVKVARKVIRGDQYAILPIGIQLVKDLNN